MHVEWWITWTCGQGRTRRTDRPYAVLQPAVLWEVLQSQPAVGHRAHHSGLYSCETRVYRKNQTQPRLLRPFLGAYNDYIPAELHRQPLKVLFQLVTRLVHLPAGACQVWGCDCVQLWLWGARFAVFCDEVLRVGVVFAARGMDFCY